MEVIFILIGISLLLAGSFLILFFKAVKDGQFEDDQTPAIRMLFENQPKRLKNSNSTPNKSK